MCHEAVLISPVVEEGALSAGVHVLVVSRFMQWNGNGGMEWWNSGMVEQWNGGTVEWGMGNG
jgi:hypothetical protein